VGFGICVWWWCSGVSSAADRVYIDHTCPDNKRMQDGSFVSKLKKEYRRTPPLTKVRVHRYIYTCARLVWTWGLHTPHIKQDAKSSLSSVHIHNTHTKKQHRAT
jgi:hypothetical protein